MHYYQFNIGDYRKDTVHLSRLEHGIYRDLIDWYYLEEKPIPKETQSVMRRLRLVSEDEAKALENVLADFFVLSDEGFRQSRIDLEIAQYHANCQKNQENGRKGGRPKGKKTQSVSSGLPNETQDEPKKTLTNNQEPITIIGDAAPAQPKKATRLSTEWQLPKVWGEWAVDTMGWAEQTVRLEADKFRDYWTAKSGKDATKLDWEATWRNWCRNAKTPTAPPALSLLVGGI